MANGFMLKNRRVGVYINNDAIQAYPDTQFYPAGALEFSNGMLKPVNAQADKVHGIYNGLEIPKEIYPGSRPTADKSSVAYGERCLFIPVIDSEYEFETDMTGSDALAILNQDALSNADLSTVKFTYASGSSNDFNGGCILANGQQRNILTSTRASDTWTITVDRPFVRAITTGDKVTATHLNVGIKNCKLSSSAPYYGISPTKGDETGGYCEITEMILNHVVPKASVRFKSA